VFAHENKQGKAHHDRANLDDARTAGAAGEEFLETEPEDNRDGSWSGQGDRLSRDLRLGSGLNGAKGKG
jgi:hypothetical protein